MLQAIGLTKRYGEHLALDRLTLDIRAGEIYCLLGANGAGKTTTINLFLVHENFVEPYGDRKQEIVFIGQRLDRVAIESALGACLLTAEEERAGPNAWSRYPDPFPSWADDQPTAAGG